MSTTNAASTKPHMTIATIGSAKVGKTTLTSTFSRGAASSGPPPAAYEELSRGTEYAASNVTFRMAKVEYETVHRKYTHLDWPSHADFVKCMIAGFVGLDAAVLVMTTGAGETKEYVDELKLVCVLKVRHIVVYMNRHDGEGDSEMEDLEVNNIREELAKNLYSDAEQLIVFGDARQALSSEAPPKPGVAPDSQAPETRPSIERLLNELDRRPLTPQHDPTQPSVAAPKSTTYFHVHLVVMDRATASLLDGAERNIVFPGFHGSGTIKLDEGTVAQPGTHVSAYLDMATPVPMTPGLRFEVHHQGHQQCIGIVFAALAVAG